MKRLCSMLLVLAFVAGGCTGGNEEDDAAERLQELATAGDTLTYEAAYTFEMSGPLAEGSRTRLRVIQNPPASLRYTELTTTSQSGNPITIGQWIVQLPEGSFACTRYPQIDDVACVETSTPNTLFGLTLVDEFFRLARTPEAFSAIEEGDGVRVAGLRGRCFRAARTESAPAGSPVPTPRFSPDRFVYEYCYSDGGILLRARRRIAGEVPEEQEERREMLLEATAVSGDVDPDEIELPGEVRDPSELRS